MAVRIRRDLGIEAELIEGDKGVFDVLVDGELIYSKHSTGRFPAEEELVRELSTRG